MKQPTVSTVGKEDHTKNRLMQKNALDFRLFIPYIVSSNVFSIHLSYHLSIGDTMKTLTLTLTSIALMGLWLPLPAHAGWTNDPYNGMVTLTNAPGNQSSPLAFHFPNGNTYIDWFDETGGNRTFYQVLNPAGIPLLENNGRPLINGNWGFNSSLASNPIVPDGQGGCIRVFADNRNGIVQIYGQRIDGQGNRLWGDTGLLLAICPGLAENALSDVTSDSLGHIFIAWRRAWDPYFGQNYVQKTNMEGQRLWGDYGIEIEAGQYVLGYQQITTDGQGGILQFYLDFGLSGPEISNVYFNHVDSLGAPVAPLIEILHHLNSTLVSVMETFDAAPDGAGGAVLAMTRYYDYGANLMRVNGNGRTIWDWNVHSLESGSVLAFLRHPDGTFWLAERHYWGGPMLYLLHRFDQAGDTLLTNLPYGGNTLSPTSNGVITGNFQVVSGHGFRTYSNRINNNGNLIWQSNVMLADSSYFTPAVSVPDAADGMILVAVHIPYQSVDGTDICAQRVNADGTLGTPNKYRPTPLPSIASLTPGQINYVIGQAGPVKIELFDLLGRRLATLQDGYLPAGEHTVRFDDRGLRSGVYFIRLQAGEDAAVKKVVVVK